MADESTADDEAIYRLWRLVRLLRRRGEPVGDLNDPAVIRALADRAQADPEVEP